MNFEGKTLILDAEDICYDCKNARICPMMEALDAGILAMTTDGFNRLTCALYEAETPPKLKVL